MDVNLFVDIATLCLRRSAIIRKGQAGKILITTMMSLAFPVFANPVTLVTETTSHCYQAHIIEYSDYLKIKYG